MGPGRATTHPAVHWRRPIRVAAVLRHYSAITSASARQANEVAINASRCIGRSEAARERCNQAPYKQPARVGPSSRPAGGQSEGGRGGPRRRIKRTASAAVRHGDIPVACGDYGPRPSCSEGPVIPVGTKCRDRRFLSVSEHCRCSYVLIRPGTSGDEKSTQKEHEQHRSPLLRGSQ